jgi:hypothetical protein
MKVKFLKEVQSGIGHFLEGQVHELDDKHIIDNWMENGLIEEIKPVRKKSVKPDEN